MIRRIPHLQHQLPPVSIATQHFSPLGRLVAMVTGGCWRFTFSLRSNLQLHRSRRNLDRSKPTLNRNPLIRSAAQWEQRIPGWTEGQSCNIGFSKTSPRIERWLSKNNLGETTVQCWVFLGYRNLPGINLFILFPHLEVNAWQVRLLLSYLYLHLRGGVNIGKGDRGTRSKKERSLGNPP